MKAAVKNFVNDSQRFVRNISRRKAAKNKRLLVERDERITEIKVDYATIADVEGIVKVHVIGWNQTYPYSKYFPLEDLRRQQWLDKFSDPNNDWFCLVLKNKNNEVIGFASGQRYSHHHLPQFNCELSKIHLLKNYQRLGLGQILIKSVAKHFIEIGTGSMVLFSEAHNPSGNFYEAMGGKRLYAANSEFHGGYGWDDLDIIVNN